MCGNGIFVGFFLLFAAAVITLVIRAVSPTISKDKHPGLAYKAYLLASILIGQSMIAAEVLHYGEYATSMLLLLALFWPLVSAAVSLMADRRWCVFPAASSVLQFSPVLYLITGPFMSADSYLILLGTLMSLGAVLTFWQIRKDSRSD